MSRPRPTPEDPGVGRPDAGPPVPDLRLPEEDLRELRDPYDLPFPDRWPSGGPKFVVVLDQLRDWRPDAPPSLAELLERMHARPRDPEPDLEAEP